MSEVGTNERLLRSDVTLEESRKIGRASCRDRGKQKDRESS